MIMLDYEFMRAAFLAGTIVAIAAGAVGYFLVLRNVAFAGHALSHVGFAGATGAVLVGVAPLWGLVLFTAIAVAAMSMLGDRVRGRDVAVGIIFSLALGLGVLFLHFYTSYATQATALLFGNVLGVSMDGVWSLLGLAIVSLAALAVISRPLLFATLDPGTRGSAGRVAATGFGAFPTGCRSGGGGGYSGRWHSAGVALMVGPAATAQRLSGWFRVGVALSVLFALAQTWLGIVLAYMSDLPPSFWITFLSFVTYAASVVATRTWRHRAPIVKGA